MPLVDAMSTQRAVRRVKPDPVDDAFVLRLIELAFKAPTQQNSQAWEFIVVKDAAVKAKLGRQNRRMWRLYRPVAARKARHDPNDQRTNKAVQWCVDNFETMPVFVVACIRGSSIRVPDDCCDEHVRIRSSRRCRICCSRRVPSGWAPTWSRCRCGATSRRAGLLGLPWNVTPVAMVPLGWPIGRYGPTKRRPVGDVVSLDRFGNRPWLRATTPG